MKNQAFVFIKPHAARNENVLSYIQDKFNNNGITVVSEGRITGQEIAEKGLIDKHYSVNAKVGTTRNPSELFLNDEAKKTFSEKFGLQWDQALADGRIVSALVMQEKLGGVTGDELIERWTGSQVEKVAGGLYVGYFKEQDTYVLNGFYPSIREVYTADDAVILYRVVDFDSDKTPWPVFRANIIGATNPASADEDSIRGYLNKHASEYGIELSYRDNVIHASASPFEALIEKNTWLSNFDNDIDPLFSALKAKNISYTQVQTWYAENPVVDLNGEKGNLIDLLEDKNTDKVVEFLTQIA